MRLRLALGATCMAVLMPVVAHAQATQSSTTLLARTIQDVMNRPHRAVGPALVTSRLHTMLASASPVAFPARTLRIDPSAFNPATLDSSHDYPVDAAGASTLLFRANHWWDYGRLNMVIGYFEGAAAQTADTGDTVLFAYQGAAYTSGAASAKAFADGVNRTQQWDHGGGCGNSVPGTNQCWIMSYQTKDGGASIYVALTVRNCTAEVLSHVGDPSVYQNDGDAITHVQAQVVVAAARQLQQSCSGATAATPTSQPAPQAPKPTPQPANNPIQPGFHGNCFTFRGEEWNNAQLTSQLVNLWWQSLQTAYNGNYPIPSGGSVPGPTQSQVTAAQQAMARIQRLIYNHRKGAGLAVYVAAVADQYGVNPKVNGPATWAVGRLVGALYYLDKAGYDEYHQANTGLGDYHTAQMLLSNTWDALKQLPCK